MRQATLTGLIYLSGVIYFIPLVGGLIYLTAGAFLKSKITAAQNILNAAMGNHFCG